MPKTTSQTDLSHKLAYARTGSYAPSVGGQSHRTDRSEMSERSAATAANHPLMAPPSTAHEKSKHTRRYFASVFAITYAIFLTILGGVLFVSDALLERGRVYPGGEIFILVIVSMSFAYFIFLYVDIRLHVRKAKRTIRERRRRHAMLDAATADVMMAAPTMATPVMDSFEALAAIEQRMRLEPLAAVSHKYCFMTGRHGEFFYLKFGATCELI